MEVTYERENGIYYAKIGNLKNLACIEKDGGMWKAMARTDKEKPGLVKTELSWTLADAKRFTEKTIKAVFGTGANQ